MNTERQNSLGFREKRSRHAGSGSGSGSVRSLVQIYMVSVQELVRLKPGKVDVLVQRRHTTAKGPGREGGPRHHEYASTPLGPSMRNSMALRPPSPCSRAHACTFPSNGATKASSSSGDGLSGSPAKGLGTPGFRASTPNPFPADVRMVLPASSMQ
jgi:hypothetical protein